MKAFEIVQIILGGLTLLAGFVPIIIHCLQKKHEKEIDAIRIEQKQKELSEKANEFLIDHENERDYLPWCTIASALHRREHHTRKIYTDFCRCPDELQKEIIKLAGFPEIKIEGNHWVNKSLESIREYIKNNHLGMDLLYDGAKYFHRGFERYRKEVWTKTPSVFDPIEKDTALMKAFGRDKIDLIEYIDEYLWFRSNDKECAKQPMPPIDYAVKTQSLLNRNDIEVCRWVIEIVFCISTIAHNLGKSDYDDDFFGVITDADAETFEDRYYETLLTIYYTFKNESAEIKNKKSKKKKSKSRIKTKPADDRQGRISYNSL